MYMYYTPAAILDILGGMNPVFCKEKSDKYTAQTLNESISFDIETTSTYTPNGEKFAFMYAWALDINDKTILGRTWQEFTDIINVISNFFGLGFSEHSEKRVIIYIHNLAFEFQFFQKLFEWHTVFATDPRKPLYAVTVSGVEFRCSYRLSGYALDKIGEQVGIPKLKGDLDYTKVRHSGTTLKQNEINYIVHDVKIVSEYIRQKIKEENGIVYIPLTKTGYVRRLFRAHCLHSEYTAEYMELMQRCTLTLQEYNIAKLAFAGGFTHANYNHCGKVQKNVESMDICSSYPTSLIAEKYPCGKGRLYNFNNFEHFESEMYSTENAYILEIRIENVKPKTCADSYISYSKCIDIKNPVKNNGRIYSADMILLAITNIDYQIMKMCYTFDVVSFANCYRYPLDYLPKPFIITLLELYKDKTELKDIEGKEKEYLSSKENINAAYGMCVMNIVRDIIEYSGKWLVNGAKQEEMKQLKEEEKQEQLEKENKKRGRFLFYLWGIFCTSYSRRRLWAAITECGYDYVYSDTDSVKILNADSHRKFFENENNIIMRKINDCLKYYNIPQSMSCPKTKDGINKPLGIWEFDGHYYKFKTLGAKRYFLLYSNDKRNKKKRKKFLLTNAGLSKKDALKYIISQPKPFDFFKIGMYIPENSTGKLTHTYIDNPIKCAITDYQNNTKMILSLSGIHLSKQDYKISIARDFANLLKGKHDYFAK